jgi:hypothetical protein
MTDAEIADQLLHVARVEDIAHQAIIFAQIEFALVAGDDAGGVLAAMLQHGQRIVDILVDVALGDDTHYPTHAFCTSLQQLLIRIADSMIYARRAAISMAASQ